MTTASEDDLHTQTNSISSQFNKLHLNTTQSLPPIAKLSPVRHIPGRCGLQNIGNTCFMNSAIQCLSSVPNLTKWAMQQQPSLSHMNVLDVYIALVQSMWSGRNTCVIPQELKEYVSRSAPIFFGYGQKDSHEFMNSLLNAIQVVDSSSFLVDLFRIHTQSKTTCNKCQYVDTTNETTTFLPLPIPQLRSHVCTQILLHDLINDFCQEDELDGQYYCQRCKTCQPARHKTAIIPTLPRALIIQLKRFPFDGTNIKIDTFVQYKLEHQNLLSNNDRYELYAVSQHSGSLAGGHYTTMARNYKTKQWYRFDDNYVEDIDSKTVLVPFIAQQAYVLIYLKQDN